MNFDLLLENITTSLTIFLTRYHRCLSTKYLEIPKNSSKFISLYLFFFSIVLKDTITQSFHTWHHLVS
jgi:hypothetical protein